MESISYKLENFEGPLDLLLHLIEKNKVNIYDIPIVMITEQYMEYIRHMDTKDMDVMSDFLVMAATLLNIKSKMLLPAPPKEDEETEDPRKELVERLLEYKMYKYASLELKDLQVDADKLLYKKSTLPKEVLEYEEEINPAEILNESNVTLEKLNSIFQDVMKKQIDKVDPIRSKFGKIEKEDVEMPKKMRYVQEYGLLHRKFSFRTLLEAQPAKMEVIVTFLCILELMKIGRVQVEQADIFDDITINYTADDVIEIGDDGSFTN
ncbi:MAG: segregation/condensation protein A [Lachnospiraceae bacterium]|nr:segregation/condensation protein A [Lachnospiraceae bacterium]